VWDISSEVPVVQRYPGKRKKKKKERTKDLEIVIKGGTKGKNPA